MSSSECDRLSPSMPDADNNTESVPIPANSIEDIKEHIDECMEAIGDCFFATSGPIPTAVNPGLLIKGLGRVGLPLSSRDARDLVNLGRETPFGIWEIDPAQVQFCNAQWSTTVRYAVSKTIEQLSVRGGESSVRADLHNLSLCQEGASFSAHQDTEKAPGMFATLVIMLPSGHQGGEVMVLRGKEQHPLSNFKSNEFSYAFLAWYAGVDYSLQPVTSGYRLVLTYNLIHHDGVLNKARLSTSLEYRNSVIDSVLTSWKKLLEDNDKASQELVYLFDQQCDEINFGLDFLKGEDQIRALRLHDACSRHGFTMYLANFEYSESWNENDDEDEDDNGEGESDDGYVDDDYYEEWTLPEVFTPDGMRIAGQITIDTQAIVQDEPFKNDSPDDEESESLGFGHVRRNEYYRRGCLVLVPRQHYNSFLYRGSGLYTRQWTNELLHRMDNSAQAEKARADLFKVCSLITGNTRPRYGDFETLVNVALKLDMPSMLVAAMEKSPCELGITSLRDLARAIASRDPSPWLPAISTSISAVVALGLRLDHIKSIDEEYDKALARYDAVQCGPEPRKHNAAKLHRCMFKALIQNPHSGPLKLQKGDTNRLVDIARSQGDAFVLDVVLPICKMVVRNMDFVADTISQLFEEIKSGWTSLSTVSALARESMTTLGQEMSAHCVWGPHKDVKTSLFQAVAYERGELPHGADGSMSWAAIIKLFRLCEILEIIDGAHALITPVLEIARAAKMINITWTSDFTLFLIPLIKSVASELPAVPGNLSLYQTLFQQVLLHYLEDYVGEKPSPPQTSFQNGERSKCYDSPGPLQDPTRSDCGHCAALNDFLAAPDRSEWRYKAAEPARKHLERHLFKVDCSSFIDRSQGSPLTLVISKTKKSYRDALATWERRRKEAKSEFEGIGHGKLKTFLGEQYDSIVELLSKVTSEKTVSNSRQPLASLAQSVQNTKRVSDSVQDGPATKRVRKVEIVDLC